MTDNEKRLEALLRQFARLINGTVRRLGRRIPVDVHQDVRQRIHISLWRKLASGQEIEHPTSYIYRVAVLETLRAAREEGRRHSVPVDDVVEQLPAAPRESGDPFDALASAEEIGRIESAIARLREDRARAVRAHLAGADVRDIMALYDWPYQKARHLIQRGMADLRGQLRERRGNG